ncbi:class A beta-lactamase-related serine hydrolase [Paenibacillus psychroresistens]|uniref:Class A beta-lactamase-related serine hydrolase n=1 Tax=Paenibacillus psychroresistens TaxID=1778678 RepID=A0A6B8RRE0_9BACL|nr:serine hydrolase domain-containing protein [Paenibacillus psychroresistens]QGQ98053.1 class A beta-lactamase-related serine hydrolase [Paenibacillus psychroresistens]
MAGMKTNTYNLEAIQLLKVHFQNLIMQNRLQGASFVISQNNRIIAKEALGSSGFNGTSFSVDAIRPVQSIVKIITALAVLKLVEQGKLNLEDKITRYLHELDCNGFRGITLRHLLTHQSGMHFDPIFFNSFHLADWISPLTESRYMTEPGTTFEYSNAGFALLGVIISRVFGNSYEQFVEEMLLMPLNMTMTSFKLSLQQESLLSLVLPREENSLAPENYRAVPRSFGGLFSTLDDLQKLGQMMLNQGTFEGKRIINDQLIQQMTSDGLGLFLDGNVIGTMSPQSFSHHGAGWSALTIDPVNELVAVIFVPSIEDFVAESLHPSMQIIGSGIRPK